MGTYVADGQIPKVSIVVGIHPRLSGKFWDTIVGRRGEVNLSEGHSRYDEIERARRILENSSPLPEDARNNGELARAMKQNGEEAVRTMKLAADGKENGRDKITDYFVG